MNIRLRILDGVCLLALLALTAGGGFCALRSARVRAVRVEHDRAVVEELAGKRQKAQAVLTRLDAAAAANRTALEELEKRLPSADPIGTFFADLDALAGRNGVKVNTVTPAAAEREAIGQRTPITLACEGTFAGAHAMLNGLERMSVLVHVEALSMRKGATAGRCNMEITCGVYGR